MSAKFDHFVQDKISKLQKLERILEEQRPKIKKVADAIKVIKEEIQEAMDSAKVGTVNALAPEGQWTITLVSSLKKEPANKDRIKAVAAKHLEEGACAKFLTELLETDKSEEEKAIRINRPKKRKADSSDKEPKKPKRTRRLYEEAAARTVDGPSE